MTWVKICGLVRPEDAQLASELGADALGFVLAPSPRRANPAQLATWLPQLDTPALKVGVFLDAPEGDIQDVIERCGLTAVQLHGHESVELCERLNRQLPVLKRVRNRAEADHYRAVCRYLLWEPYPQHPTGPGEIWAGGLTLDNLSEVCRRHPWGLDVARGVENQPGTKSHHLLRQFLIVAKQDLMEA